MYNLSDIKNFPTGRQLIMLALEDSETIKHMQTYTKATNALQPKYTPEDFCRDILSKTAYSTKDLYKILYFFSFGLNYDVAGSRKCLSLAQILTELNSVNAAFDYGYIPTEVLDFINWLFLNRYVIDSYKRPGDIVYLTKIELCESGKTIRFPVTYGSTMYKIPDNNNLIYLVSSENIEFSKLKLVLIKSEYNSLINRCKSLGVYSKTVRKIDTLNAGNLSVKIFKQQFPKLVTIADVKAATLSVTTLIDKLRRQDTASADNEGIYTNITMYIKHILQISNLSKGSIYEIYKLIKYLYSTYNSTILEQRFKAISVNSSNKAYIPNKIEADVFLLSTDSYLMGHKLLSTDTEPSFKIFSIFKDNEINKLVNTHLYQRDTAIYIYANCCLLASDKYHTDVYIREATLIKEYLEPYIIDYISNNYDEYLGIKEKLLKSNCQKHHAISVELRLADVKSYLIELEKKCHLK